MCEQPQLFHEMKYWASRRNWKKTDLKVTDTNSWVVPSTRFKFQKWGFALHPSIEINLDSNTQTSSFWTHQCWVEAAKHFATECRAGGVKGGQADVKKKEKLPKTTQKLEVLWSSHFLVEDAVWPMSLKWIWNSKWEISPSLPKFTCEQLQVFAEMKY